MMKPKLDSFDSISFVYKLSSGPRSGELWFRTLSDAAIAQLDVTLQVRPSMVPLSPKLWFKAVINAPCPVYNEAPPVGSRVIAIILRVLVAQINEELLLVLCESQCVFQGMVKDRQGVDWVRRG